MVPISREGGRSHRFATEPQARAKAKKSKVPIRCRKSRPQQMVAVTARKMSGDWMTIIFDSHEEDGWGSRALDAQKDGTILRHANCMRVDQQAMLLRPDGGITPRVQARANWAGGHDISEQHTYAGNMGRDAGMPNRIGQPHWLALNGNVVSWV